MDDEDEMVL